MAGIDPGRDDWWNPIPRTEGVGRLAPPSSMDSLLSQVAPGPSRARDMLAPGSRWPSSTMPSEVSSTTRRSPAALESAVDGLQHLNLDGLDTTSASHIPHTPLDSKADPIVRKPPSAFDFDPWAPPPPTSSNPLLPSLPSPLATRQGTSRELYDQAHIWSRSEQEEELAQRRLQERERRLRPAEYIHGIPNSVVPPFPKSAPAHHAPPSRPFSSNSGSQRSRNSEDPWAAADRRTASPQWRSPSTSALQTGLPPSSSRANTSIHQTHRSTEAAARYQPSRPHLSNLPSPGLHSSIKTTNKGPSNSHTYPKGEHSDEPQAGDVLRSGLPATPDRSTWSLWAGNVPTDASEDELWQFFSTRSPPPPEHDVHDLELVLTAGVESIHLIARSNCAFINFIDERHLLHAIRVANGVSLRPSDRRCKPLLCRIRQREDDAKSGVGAQRGGGLHKAWVAKLAALEVVTTSARRASVSSAASSSASTSSSLFLAYFPKRFFILKSHNIEDLESSVLQGTWRTQSHNEPVLEQAYRTAREGVFIVFSANRSGEWFGYARMTGPPMPIQAGFEDGHLAVPAGIPGDPSTGETLGKPFRVEWIYTQRIPFSRTRHIVNAFNSGREVKISRDGTEVEPDAGAQLLNEFELASSARGAMNHSRPSFRRPMRGNSYGQTSYGGPGRAMPPR